MEKIMKILGHIITYRAKEIDNQQRDKTEIY